MSRPVVLVCLLLAGCVATESVRDGAPAEPPRSAVEGSPAENARAMASAAQVVARCQTRGCAIPVGSGVEVDTVLVDRGVVVVRFSRDLGDAPVRADAVAAFEAELAQAIGGIYPGPVRAETRGGALADLVPQAFRPAAEQDPARRFAPPVTGPPLVRPASGAPPTAGIAGRHVALWPSHGWLYANGGWGWQRARLFTTVEDVLTVEFVTRQLAPMLERAGAVTLLPRERDVQAAEVIVDDGQAVPSDASRWRPGPAGFGARASYGDGDNPFRLGTTHDIAGGGRAARVTWTPALPHAGSYAVHVSYASGPDRSDAARYTVSHAGGQTDVLVNQQIGGGTWVYLGTFEFEAGTAGSVSLRGDQRAVSADAVRFGGGQGVISRGPSTSGRPRWTEASRYYQQFAGAPAFVYDISGEPDSDYVDDYRSRGEWVNWLRGAPFTPTGHPDEPGLGIPVDLALAWHTDAGIDRDGTIGTLAIYNVAGMDSTRTFPNGTSRLANRDLAEGVQTQIVDDLRRLYDPDWRRRSLWDRAYSEATRPQVPSLLLELLSHQNFRDMRYALDPRFQFDAARAVYKGMGAFLAQQRGDAFVSQPLRPTHLAAVFEGGTRQDNVRLSWQPQPDPLEPGADATSYLVQTRDGDIGWSDGAAVETTSVRLPAPPVGVVRSYRVVAVNAGGASRPSAAVAVGRARDARAVVLVIDGFDRVAPPDAVDRRDRAGFTDPVGVPEGLSVITTGAQRAFDPSLEYVDDAQPGWGASGARLEGTPILGNTRDHAAAHGRALLAAGRSFASASDEAVEDGTVALDDRFATVDLVLGLERRTAWPDPDDARPPAFEALPSALRQRLGAYLDRGGSLIVSGAHWAGDAGSDPASAAWVRDRLGVSAGGVLTPTSDPATLGLAVGGALAPFATDYGPDRLAVRSPDVLVPGDGAAVLHAYGGGTQAVAVSFRRTVSWGIPLESLLDPDVMARLLADALAALDVR